MVVTNGKTLNCRWRAATVVFLLDYQKGKGLFRERASSSVTESSPGKLTASSKHTQCQRRAVKVIPATWALEPESVTPEPASYVPFSIYGNAIDSQPQPSDKYPKAAATMPTTGVICLQSQ